MDSKSLLAGASVVAACFQYGLYVKEVLWGKTKPHAFSWFVWGLPCGIVFAAQLLEGAGAGSWATATTTILCTAIFILSLFYGEKTITRLDWAALLISLFSLGLWAVTKNPVGSVILITLVDVIGFVPTLRKSYHKPHEEPVICYCIGGLKWLLSLAVMGDLNFVTLAYPVAMVFANWAGAGLLLARRASLAIKVK